MLSASIEIESVPVIGPGEACSVADDIFRGMPLLRCIVVVNDDMRPIGLIPRNDFLLQLSQRFGRALYENRPISQLMVREPLIVAESLDFDIFVRELFVSGVHDVQDCFILTGDDGHYRGVSNGKAVMSALLDIQKSLVDTLSASQKQLVETNSRLGDEVRERRIAEEEAINASNRDPLTGLHNRAPFVGAVSKWIDQRQAFNLLFIDLDGFKTLNDVYGHLAGDEALRIVARRIGKMFNAAVCARFGGDEFAVAFRKMKSPEAEVERTKQLHDLIVEPFNYNGAILRTGASLGLARFPHHASEASELLQSADMAMLRAKRGGGGVGVFSHDLDAGDRSMRNQLGELTEAIRSKLLIPHFQPIFELGSNGQPVFYEVLARWPTAEAPIGRPDHFIPLAEREGLIDELFWLIFSKACYKACQHDFPLSLAFNVSARQLQDEKFPSRLLAAIEKFSLQPSQVEVEVTETAMIANEKLADTALRTLTGEGLSVALDDFGTGFSSLSVLHRYSFSKLKIDHSFVRRMANDQRSHDIVASTILMAERLGLRTVAEGVEDAYTLELLRNIGCDLVQGYHLARPGPDFLAADSEGQRAVA